MFQIRWLRRLIRRNTRKIPEDVARHKKQRLSIIYFFLSWNAFGLVCYMCATGRSDWAKAGGFVTEDVPPARSWARILGIPKAQVIQVSGFTVTGEYEIDEPTNQPDNESELLKWVKS